MKIAKYLVNGITGCWEWLRYVDKAGYGHCAYKGKSMGAHRAYYQMHKGEIPAGLQIDHLCRNRKCVNPKHLEAVTKRENFLRGISPAAWNARKTTCPKGHPYSYSEVKQKQPIHRGCRKCNRRFQNKRYKVKRPVILEYKKRKYWEDKIALEMALGGELRKK